jgi:hypothetical protein
MATRPSTLPTQKPVALGKQEIVRVCHLSGEVIVCIECKHAFRIRYETSTDLMYSGRLIQVNDLDMFLRRPDGQKWIPDVHAVNTFLSLYTGNRSWTLQIPVLRHHKYSERSGVLGWTYFDRLVPASSCENTASR